MKKQPKIWRSVNFIQENYKKKNIIPKENIWLGPTHFLIDAQYLIIIWGYKNIPVKTGSYQM